MRKGAVSESETLPFPFAILSILLALMEHKLTGLTMTSNISTVQIEGSIRALVAMAKEMTWNHFSNNNRYILTEIKDPSENFHEQRKARKKENNQKT